MLRSIQATGRHAIIRNSTKRCYKTSSMPVSTVAQLLKSNAPASSASQDGLVTVNGFVRTVRKQKRVAFAAIGDGTTVEAVQCVLTPEQAKDLSTGSAVRVTGQWQESPSGKEQSHEVLAKEVDILGENDAETYPIQKKFHSLEYLRTVPHLRSRIPFNSLILRLRSEAIRHATDHFYKGDFIQTQPPIITSSDCEGAGEVFTVSSNPGARKASADGGGIEGFFKTDKYLTVSSQLHLESLAQAVGKVWTLSPTFRAEHSDTPRHLAEFYMLEVEQCFITDVNSVMDTLENLLRAIVTGLHSSPISTELFSANLRHPSEESPDTKKADVRSRWEGILGGPWPRITYTDAVAVLEGSGVAFEFKPRLGSGLQAEHEKYLAETLGRGSPLFVTDYPRDIKAFYMAPSATQQGEPTVACFDLLVPDLCEIAGGSMREHRYEQLLQNMKVHGLLNLEHGKDEEVTQDLAAAVPAALQWYVDLRKYGSVPHGGFGLGFDRFLAYLAGVASIRDVASFPRWYGRCDC